jgi:membrane protein
MRERLKDFWELISTPFHEWTEDNATQLAAAIAYYTIFSFSPIIIISLAVVGQIFNQDAVRAQLIAQISSFMGQDTADFISKILENSAHSSSSFIASCISFVILLVGASGVFIQIQFALNKIWDVSPQAYRGLKSTLKNRILSFLMVLAIGFLLLVFLLVSSAASSINAALYGSSQNSFLPQAINLIVIFVILTALFAMIFRTVPDKEITWTDVWLGAGLTALLFMIGRYAIGLYISISRSGSTYGAAGSLVVLIVWIFYSAQIFLLGAEFTQVYARKFGSHKRAQ